MDALQPLDADFGIHVYITNPEKLENGEQSRPGGLSNLPVLSIDLIDNEVASVGSPVTNGNPTIRRNMAMLARRLQR